MVRLGGRLEQIDQQCATRGNRAFYLSVSKFYGSGCRPRRRGPLKDPKRSRVVIEKPFGRDYGSAQALNQWFRPAVRRTRSFASTITCETVQNIMVLRFANTIFEPIWNRNYISVFRSPPRKLSELKTAGYYESAGALRDMVQNHLTQMLAITARTTRAL